mgnify:FL=1
MQIPKVPPNTTPKNVELEKIIPAPKEFKPFEKKRGAKKKKNIPAIINVRIAARAGLGWKRRSLKNFLIVRQIAHKSPVTRYPVVKGSVAQRDR